MTFDRSFSNAVYESGYPWGGGTGSGSLRCRHPPATSKFFKASGVVVGQKCPDNNARPMLPLVA